MSTHASSSAQAAPRARSTSTCSDLVDEVAPQAGIPLLSVRIAVPRPSSLAFYAGIAALAAIEVLDWPVAVMVALGHALSHQNQSDALRELGEALQAA